MNCGPEDADSSEFPPRFPLPAYRCGRDQLIWDRLYTQVRSISQLFGQAAASTGAVQ